jgi:hypothetical protein
LVPVEKALLKGASFSLKRKDELYAKGPLLGTAHLTFSKLNFLRMRTKASLARWLIDNATNNGDGQSEEWQ